jgi:hypothetical protein
MESLKMFSKSRFSRKILLVVLGSLLILLVLGTDVLLKRGKAQGYLRGPSPDERLPSYTLMAPESALPVYRAPQDDEKLGSLASLQEVEVFETEHHLYKAPSHYKNVRIDHWFDDFGDKGIEIAANIGSITIREEKPIVSVTVVGSGCASPGYNIVEWWADGENLSTIRGQLIKRQRIDNLKGQHNAWIQRAFSTKKQFKTVEEANEFVARMQSRVYAMSSGYYMPGSLMGGLYENTAYFRIGDATHCHRVVVRAGSTDYEEPGTERERYPGDYVVRLIDVVVKK